MYNLVSFVVRGKIRKKVLENLTEPRTPTELSEIIGTQRSTISRSIRSLMEKGLVECITPDEHMGRYYKITEVGKNVLSKIYKSK